MSDNDRVRTEAHGRNGWVFQKRTIQRIVWLGVPRTKVDAKAGEFKVGGRRSAADYNKCRMTSSRSSPGTSSCCEASPTTTHRPQPLDGDGPLAMGYADVTAQDPGQEVPNFGGTEVAAAEEPQIS